MLPLINSSFLIPHSSFNNCYASPISRAGFALLSLSEARLARGATCSDGFTAGYGHWPLVEPPMIGHLRCPWCSANASHSTKKLKTKKQPTPCPSSSERAKADSRTKQSLELRGVTPVVPLQFLIPHSSFLIPNSSFLIPHS